MKDKKLFDVVSKKTGDSVTIHDVTLTFQRFTLTKHGEYEENGISLEKLPEILEKEFSRGVELVYDLLTEESKELTGSLAVFKDSVDLNDFILLAGAFSNTIMNAQYISDKESTVEKK